MREMKGKWFSVVANVLLLSIVGSYASACAPETEESGGKESLGPYEPTVYDSNGVDLDDYQIVYSTEAGEATKYAAECLQTYVKKATGITVPIVNDGVDETGTEILLGKTNRAESATIEYSSFGEEGYRIKAVGDNLVIAANDSRGLIYGVHAFLEELGYRFYSYYVESYPLSDEVFIPETIDVSWTPVFDYRELHFAGTWDAAYAAKQGINGNYFRADLKKDEKYGGYSGYIGDESYMVHTMVMLLPEAEYFGLHPDYYALVDGQRQATQPCFSSQGAADVIYQKSVQMIQADPTSNILSISQNDNYQFCECEDCLESYEKYGYSGTLLNFVNPIAEKIKKDYPHIIVETLAYNLTLELPKEGIKPASNVRMRVCMKTCNYHVRGENCELFDQRANELAGWKAISNQISVYYYVINWQNLYDVLPNYETLYDVIQMCAENNVKGMYCEGFPLENPEFGELRAYLLTKLMKDPYMSKSEYYYHMEDFLYGYYGEAGEYIKEYIDVTNAKIQDDCEKYGEPGFWHKPEQNFHFTIDEQTQRYDDETMAFIDKCNELWDLAEESVDNVILPRVQKSRIHWTYTELYNTKDRRYGYATDEEKEELVARNRQLYVNMFRFNTTNKALTKPIATGVTDFTVSPKSW